MKLRIISSLILGATVALAASSATAADPKYAHLPNVTLSNTPEKALVNALLGGNSDITIVSQSFTSAHVQNTSGVLDDGRITMSNGSSWGHSAGGRYGGDLLEKGLDAYHTYVSYYANGVRKPYEEIGSNAALAALVDAHLQNVHDTVLLTFSFTLNDPTINAIETSFIFATDETSKVNWHGDGTRWSTINNDVFAFWVDDVNYALLPDGNIVTVYNAKDYFIDGSDLGYLSKTEEIKITALLDPTRDVHTITIAIADVDSWKPKDVPLGWGGVNGYEEGALYDSGVFISELKFTTVVPEPETYAMMLAGLAMVGAVARRRRQK